MGMTAKKAAIVGVLSAGLVTLGLVMAPAQAETVSGPYTMSVGRDITDIAAYVGANCNARGESLKDYSVDDSGENYLVTYTCVRPE
jgi:hypothetical protein